jgi:hypothetical protein
MRATSARIFLDLRRASPMADKARAEKMAANSARLLAAIASQAAPVQSGPAAAMVVLGSDAELQRLLTAAANQRASQLQNGLAVMARPAAVAAEQQVASGALRDPHRDLVMARANALRAAMAASAPLPLTYAAVASGLGRATPITGSAARPATTLPVVAQAVMRQLAPGFGSAADSPRPSIGGRDQGPASRAPALSVQVSRPDGGPLRRPASAAGEESPIFEPSIPASLQSLLGLEVEEDQAAAPAGDALGLVAAPKRAAHKAVAPGTGATHKVAVPQGAAQDQAVDLQGNTHEAVALGIRATHGGADPAGTAQDEAEASQKGVVPVEGARQDPAASCGIAGEDFGDPE